MDPITQLQHRPRTSAPPRIVLVLILLGALTLALFPPVAAGAQSGSAPVVKEDCFKGGWRDFGGMFRNQGQCVSYVATEAKHFTEIKLLATNDFHGRLLPPPGDDGGAVYLSTHMNAIRDVHPNTLFVDAGDLVGATPVLSNLFRDEPTVDVMNAIGLDIQTVGNHEFDRGQDEILRRLEGGCLDGDCSYRGDTEFAGQDFVTLSTNVTVTATGEALTYPYDIITVAGVDIGFIGVTTVTTPRVVHPDGIVGLSFHPEVEAVNNTVPDVEAAGADIIVVLMHEGGRQDGGPNECVDFRGASADIVPHFDDAVDVVVEGHTHQSYVCDLEDGPLVTQAYEYGKMFTEITLVYDHRRGGEIVARSAHNHVVTRDVTPDPKVVDIIEFYEVLAGPAMEEIVGTSEVPIPRTGRAAESAQGNLATDALLDQYPVDFAFQNSGGLRADLTDPDDMDGDLFNIRRRHVLEVWPFGNLVALAEVDGPLLKAILDNGVHEIGGGRFIQVGGLRIDYFIADPDATPFPRGEIVNVEYWNHPDFADGTPVDLSPSASYTIALNDFMAAGGDFYPVLGDAVFSLQDPLEVAVERYLMANSPVNPQVEGRIVEVGAP
jgi:5'-nucleotidase